jgi:hypothetical protein
VASYPTFVAEQAPAVIVSRKGIDTEAAGHGEYPTMTPPNPLAADLDLLTIPKAIVECSSSDPVSRFEN